MRSLRKSLLIALCIALVIVGACSATLAFLAASRETAAMLDYQMQQIARLATIQAPSGAGPQTDLIPRQSIDHDADDEVLVWISDPQGRSLFASQQRVRRPPNVKPGFQDINLDGQSYRVLAQTTNARSIVVAQQNQARWEMASAASLTALMPLVTLVAVFALVIALVIRAQFRPVQTAIKEITARPPFALAAVATAGLPTEIRPLVDAMNRLLTRLADAVKHEQRFLTDAAHALRTPLTALQLQADVLDYAGSVDERQERLAELRAGIRRATRLATQLLALAREDLQPPTGKAQSDLDVTIANSIALYAPVAEARAVRLQASSHSGLRARSSAGRLSIMLCNLLDNALRYTPRGGSVELRVSRVADVAVIEVLDEGPGLPEGELQKVFERFYRAAGDSTEGSGLGLAVVQSLAEQLGAQVSLSNRRDRTGLVAQLRLPLASEPLTLATEPTAI